MGSIPRIQSTPRPGTLVEEILLGLSSKRRSLEEKRGVPSRGQDDVSDPGRRFSHDVRVSEERELGNGQAGATFRCTACPWHRRAPIRNGHRDGTKGRSSRTRERSVPSARNASLLPNEVKGVKERKQTNEVRGRRLGKRERRIMNRMLASFIPARKQHGQAVTHRRCWTRVVCLTTLLIPPVFCRTSPSGIDRSNEHHSEEAIMRAKESRESVLVANSLKYKFQEQEAVHNGSLIHLTTVAVYEASTQDFAYLSDEVVDVTSSLTGPAEISILSPEPFSQFSVILFQVNTNGVRSDGDACELDSLQCLSKISIQLHSDSLPDFEWPQVPLDVLIGKDKEPLPSGWYQISFEVAPYGNIWGNSTFTSFSLVDTQGVLDSFQVRDIGVSSTELRLPEGLPGPMMETRAAPLSLLDRLCGMFNFFFCEQEVEPPLPDIPVTQPPSLDPSLPPTELLPSLESPGPFNVIQLRRNKKGKAFVFYLPIGPSSNDNSSADSFSALVFGHGLGATVNLYSQMLRNIASHGFVICGPDTPNLFNGKDMAGCVSLLEEESTNPSSPLYGRIKDGPLGFFGHSMGGRGAAAAAVLVGKTSGTVVSMQPAPFYDGSQIGCPIFLSAGSLDPITPPASIRASIYRGSNPPKMMATLAGVGHLNPVNFVGGQQFTPYAIGWFKLYLENEVRFDPLFWDASASGSIINDARMSRVDYVK